MSARKAKCATLLVFASHIAAFVEAEDEVACVGHGQTRTCAQVQQEQSQSGEACDYLTNMGYDCSQCHSCPGGYLMDMTPSTGDASTADPAVACVGHGETRTCAQVQQEQSQSGEACDHLTTLLYDCSQCHSCPGGYLMDMPPSTGDASTADPEAVHHPDQCRESDGSNDCCAGAGDGDCAYGYERVDTTPCGHGHWWCDAYGCMAYECHKTNAMPKALIIAIIIVAILSLYVGSMTFVYCLVKKTRESARRIPHMCHVPPPAAAVDIPSDSNALDSCFTVMGRPEMMPAQLRPHMTPQEYGTLFQKINATMSSTMGFRVWHLALWIPMIAFWAIGGFMIMIWGIERYKNMAVINIGNHVEPFCREKGINYVLMMATQAGKHGGESRPTVIRFFLPTQVEPVPLAATVVGAEFS